MGSGFLKTLFGLNERMPKKIFIAVGVAQVVIMIAGWLIAPLVFPTPIAVVEALPDLFRNESLLGHLIASLVLSIEAILLTTIIALSIAYATAIPFMRPLAGIMSLWRFSTPVGLVFIFNVMVPDSHYLKLALLTFFMSGFLLPAMVDVVSQVSRADFDQCRSLGMSEARAIWEVVVLGTFDKAFDNIRNVAAMGWAMLCTVEGLARSQGGVGVLLMNQDKHFILAAVFALNFVILACGMIQDFALVYLKRYRCPHVYLASERA